VVLWNVPIAMIVEGTMTEDNSTSTSSNMSKVPPIPKRAEVDRDPRVLEAFNDTVVEEFRATQGRVGGPFKDSNVLLLTMIGAKSGRPRTTPLEYFRVNGRLLIVATRGGAEQNPAWVHNLRANPHVHVDVGAESYDVLAEEISGNERGALFDKIVELCPRIATYPTPSRVIPVFEFHRA
jgi:deazaflavin-dependent oxidoreductase (nitroreductase family)